MEKNAFVQLLKCNNVVNLASTTDAAVAAVAPVITRMRMSGYKGKTLSDWAVEAGVSPRSASSLISDLHAVGAYLRDYPEKMNALEEEHTDKIWRKMFLCPARRVHRLKKGSSAERDAKAEVLQHHGRASLQVATALKTWEDNKAEIDEALEVLKQTHYHQDAAPVVEVAATPEPTVEELAEELAEFAPVEEATPVEEAPKPQPAKATASKKKAKRK